VVAIVVAIFAVGNPLALFANAKASLAGTAAGLSGAPNQVATVPAIQRVSPEPARAAPEPVVAIRSASVDPTAQENQPSLGARAVSPTARSGPTRDEIASAFKTARQGQPEAAPPPAAAPVATAPVVAAAPAAAVPSAAPPAARRIDAEELATLLKRAKSFDRDRRHRACAIAAETCSGRARGQRRPSARSDLRSSRAWEAGYAKHRSRSGVGA